jgi:diguanylate cyclase (GGDEF)-like protein/PAS domain S-box-containing protein
MTRVLPWQGLLAAALTAAAAAVGALDTLQAEPGVLPLTAVALALLSRLGPAIWPGLLLGTLGGVLATTPDRPWLALAVAGCALGSVSLAAAWLRTHGFEPALERRRDLMQLGAVGIAGACGLSSAAAVIVMAAGAAVAPLQLPVVWLGRWFAESLGLLLVGLPLMARSARAWHDGWTHGRWGMTLPLALFAVVSIVGALVLHAAQRTGLAAAALVPALAVAWLVARAGLCFTGLMILLPAAAWPVIGSLAGRWTSELAPTGLTALPWGYLGGLAALAALVQVIAGDLSRGARRWQLALESAGMAVAEWNLRGHNGFVSSRWRDLLADPQGDRTGQLSAFLGLVHPDDREDIRLSIESLSHPDRTVVTRQLRARPTADWAWYELHAIVAERDAQGAPVRLVVTLADVQARRSAEERQRLSSSLFQNLHEGLLIVDAELRVLDVNPTYCQMLGLLREDLIGSVPSLLRAATPDAALRAQQAAMWAGLRATGSWSGEMVERRRTGEPCALHVTVFTVPSPEGDTRYHVLMVTDVTEARLQRERLERQAHFDELTRLPNRARLSQLLLDAMASTDREGYLLTVCYLDLDHFKAVNDKHGHEAGDRLLVELANRLRGALRAHSSWSDVAARLGGDEFVLLLRAGSMDEARLAVERVARVVAQPYLLAVNAPPVVLTASIGATVYPIDRSDADTLLRHADHAMYGAKQAGRDRHVFFDLEQSRRTEERVMAVGRVQEALDNRELVLHYQPKVDLKRGTVLGVEALLRWNHPDHGVVAPAQFLPLIEHTGLSARVGDWVLAQALEQLDAWQQAGLDLSVSVNVSARHLQEPDFAQRLAELLARHGRPLGPRLELEVLETAALADIGFTSALLERCAGLGVRFALDDFGTGYSTLTYLKRLPVQVLKIDRSFVHNMLDDAQDRAIVEGVVSLARTFDCVAVAEGVETPAQARALLDLGCEVGQGAGIAAPMPAAEVARFVREWRGMFNIQVA